MVQDPPMTIPAELKKYLTADMSFAKSGATLAKLFDWAREQGIETVVSEERMYEFHKAQKLQKGEIIFCITGVEGGKAHLWMLERLIMRDEEIITDLGWENIDYKVQPTDEFLF